MMGYCKNESLSRVICFLARDIQNFTDRILRPYNVTVEQLYVLRCLSEDNTGLTQREICQRTTKTPANVTRIIDRLERKSFIVRKTCPSDRRAFLVVLTGQGQSLLQQADVVLKSFSSRLRAGIDAEAQNIMKGAVGIMSANVDRMSVELREKGQLLQGE